MDRPIELRSDNAAGVAPEILAAVAAADEGSALAYGADEVASAAVAAPHRTPADPYTPTVGVQDAEQHPYGRRFPGTVRAEKSIDLPRARGEGQPVHRQTRPEPLGETDRLFFRIGEAGYALAFDERFAVHLDVTQHARRMTH